MAGYIFSIAKEKWQDFCDENLSKGFFTPYCVEITSEMTERKKKIRNKILVATFGDIITMRPGDNIYFLSNRKLYGVGITKKIGDDCKYDNYIGASSIRPDHEFEETEFLTECNTRARWVCLFEPNPYFFKNGVDMDDVLQYRPSAFKMLRAFEGLSFIKIDDEENRALKEFICLKNEKNYDDIDSNIFKFDSSIHDKLSACDLSYHKMDLIKALSDKDNFNFVNSEMYIECVLLQYLAEQRDICIGNWDYSTHQVIASPFKPLKYIDKIDIFGYRFSKHYADKPNLITKYLLVELKKGKIYKDTLEQAMQYVDWICSEYAAGDYSMIEAYVIGNSAEQEINAIKEEVCQRSFISSSHPATPEKWNSMHVVKYSIGNTVSFEKI